MRSRSSLFGVLFGIFISLLRPSPIRPQPRPTGNATVTYPNDTEGLRRLLDDMLVAARSEDPSKLKSLIQQTEIPNYRSWFTKNFGQEKGESWSKPYGKWLEKHEKEFQELLVKLARMDGEFAVEKMDTAKAYDLLNGPIDGYLVSWKRPAAPMSEQLVKIGDFFFVEGSFRWDSTTQYFPFQKPKTGSIVPAKLLEKVQPEYPEGAREKRIEGTVKLQIIVRKDGTVAVQNVVEGDPALSPAAIEAVRQWRYEPWQLNGQPIEMQTTVDVVFSLTQ
jgi:TonB family protein